MTATQQRFRARAVVESHEPRVSRYRKVPYNSYRLRVTSGVHTGTVVRMYQPWVEQRFSVGSAINVIVSPVMVNGRTLWEARWARQASLWFWSTDAEEAQYTDICIDGWKEWYSHGCDSHTA